MSHQSYPTIPEDVSAMYRTNYIGVASFTLLIWDHIDTFVAEVEYIWMGQKGPLVYLFIMNRYLTPLGFIMNLFAYFQHVWTYERCRHFVRFEGAMTMIGINIVALMMFLRMYALYRRQILVLVVVGSLLLVQVAMNAWLLTRGEAVIHNKISGVLSCTMIFDPSISVLASSSAWLPLLYDTVVLVLTLYKTLSSVRILKNTSSIMKRLLEDGLIYYAAIFCSTGVLTIMIIVSPPGLKNITAQLELLLTVAMMSRITLNLRKSVGKVRDMDKPHAILPSTMAYYDHSHSMDFEPARQYPVDINIGGAHGLSLAETSISRSSPGNRHDRRFTNESESWELQTIGGTINAHAGKEGVRIAYPAALRNKS